MNKRHVYFEKENEHQSWVFCNTVGWYRVDDDAYRDWLFKDYDYFNVYEKQENWLGDRAKNPIPMWSY